MITFDEAIQIIKSESNSLPVVTLKLQESIGCHLAKPVTARFDLPRFDNSAVDGFCVCCDDLKNLPIQFPLADTIAAGDRPSTPLLPGTCRKIFTGAVIPAGADAVVMREYVQEEIASVTFSQPISQGENIRYRGEEVTTGTEIFITGTTITPSVAAMIAAFGYDQVPIYRKPRISILISGYELLSPGQELQDGKIYDSNQTGLTTWLQQFPCEDIIVQHVPDDLALISQTISDALIQSDILITVGGISVGDLDFMRRAFTQNGIREHYWKVAMKPGKPNYFGTFSRSNESRCLVFGLPGNPVSALVSAQLFISIALRKLLGEVDPEHSLIPARIANSYSKKAGREEFVRGLLEFTETGVIARTLDGQESHMISTLSKANALLRIPSDVTVISEGTVVKTIPLRV